LLPFGARTFQEARDFSRAQVLHGSSVLALLDRTYKRDRDGKFATGGVREALSGHSTAEEVSAAATAEAKRITGRTVTFDLAGSDPQIAAEHAEGVLRGLEKYPDVDLYRVKQGGDTLIEASGAHAVYERNQITFTNAAQAGGADAYRRSLTEMNDSGFGVSSSPMGVALHEFGHAMMDRGAGGFAGQVVAARAAADKGISVSEHVRREISGYATSSGYELGAEAFADVMLNGRKASKLSRQIVSIEEEAAR
jgi:hypothetical protein